VLFSIYKIGVTFIKVDIRSSLEEKDGHVLQNAIMHRILFTSIYLYFESKIIIVNDPSTFNSNVLII
jgi:hypothetical protein